MKPMKLTRRDRDVMRFLAAKRAAPLDVLARRFFARDPRNGRPSKSPLRACLRRLDDLRRAGRLLFKPLSGAVIDDVKPSLVYLSSETAKEMRVNAKPLHPRHLEHQVATMRACEQIRESLEAAGGEVETYQLEAELLADAFKGHKGAAGETFDGFPDALMTIRATEGAEETVLPIEYVSAHYSNQQITDKAKSLPPTTAWYSDTPKTAQRVQQITGAQCHVV